MKMIKAIVAGLVMLAVVGCASNQNKSNYTAYLETVQKIESNKAIAEESSRIAKSAEYSAMAAGCATSDCTATVSAFKAIADVVASLAGQNGGSSSRIAAPQREPTFSEQLLGWAGVLVPGVTQYAGIVESNRTQRHVSDNSAAVSVSQNQTWAGIIGSQGTAWSGAVHDVASTPSIVVGGNYGNTTTNTAGANMVSGDNNTLGDGNGNSGRYNSAGPYDSSGDCRDAASCDDNSGGN